MSQVVYTQAPPRSVFTSNPDIPTLRGIAPITGFGNLGGLGVMDTATWQTIGYVAGTVGMALGAYHGYKRNRGSISWAIGWALLGGLVPIITIPVSLAQGFGKPAKR